jgi:TonB family protein
MPTCRFVLALLLALTLSHRALAADGTTAVWSDGHASALQDEELVKYALTKHWPGYPPAAQKTKTVGSGLYELRIDKAGVIKTVVIVKSSGSDVLDKAAMTAFRMWRFKPGIFISVRIPVSWSANPVRD